MQLGQFVLVVFLNQETPSLFLVCTATTKTYQILGYGTKCMLYEKERMLKELIIKLKMPYIYIYIYIYINMGFQINDING